MTFLRPFSLCLIFLSATSGPSIALDQRMAHPIPMELAADSLTAYARGMARLHRTEMTCVSDAGRSSAEAAWTLASAQMLASLSANKAPSDKITATKSALSDLPPGLPEVDCANDSIKNSLHWLQENSWTKQLSERFAYYNFRFVDRPVTADELKVVKEIVDRNVAPEARMLQCSALVWPPAFNYLLGDWNDYVTDVADLLSQRGVPAEEITALLAPVQPAQIWQLSPADKHAELAASCRAEKEWSERMGSFSYYSFKSDIETILGVQP